MTLTRGQREALQAICDTFVPAAEGLPSATDLAVPQALLQAVQASPRASERRRFAALLSAFAGRLDAARPRDGLRRFAGLPQAGRERALLGWCDSRMGPKRAAFQSLRTAIVSLSYISPGPDGPNPRWAAIGYPGPIGPPDPLPPRALTPMTVDADTTLDCDVCVVGSGAGGATAAAVLADAGLDVVILEAGDHLEDADFDGAEAGAYARMYEGSAALATADHSVGLLAGTCLGGGTVVNYSTSFRTPDEVRREWTGMGARGFASAEFDASLDAVCERLGVNLDHNRASSRERIMRRGLDALGWHVDAMPRNVIGCEQGRVCGSCGLGCRIGAKQSAVKTWLADAEAAGARIFVRTRVERVVVRHAGARGVEARTRDGHRVTVRARAVVAAAGALHTPALLRRSGLTNPNIGRHLRLHPVTAVFGVFNEEVRPWEGTMQALYSDQHRDLHDGYGVKYETAPVHPGLAAGFLPWRGAREHAELMAALPHVVGIGALLRDRDGGEVRVGRDGHPVAAYALSAFDLGHVRTGVEGAARILEAAGARRIVTAHSRPVEFCLGTGSPEQLLRDADAWGWGAGRCVFYSFHIMGTARMGDSPAGSACDPHGEAWEARGLFVADGSVFPTAPGVNPMISIEAAAHLNARTLAARLI